MVGNAPMIRVSSAILPSLIGTLKSTRIKTRLPEMSTSFMVFLFMPRTLLIWTVKAHYFFFEDRSIQFRIKGHRVKLDIHDAVQVDMERQHYAIDFSIIRKPVENARQGKRHEQLSGG